MKFKFWLYMTSFRAMNELCKLSLFFAVLFIVILSSSNSNSNTQNVVLDLSEPDRINPIIFIPIAIILGIIAFYTIRDILFLKKLKDDDILDQVLEDFKASKRIDCCHARFGNTWVFGRGMTRIVKYDVIINAYEYVHKTNLSIDDHQIKYTDKSTNTRTLCKLTKKCPKEQVMSVFLQLLIKNPEISLGYY